MLNSTKKSSRVPGSEIPTQSGKTTLTKKIYTFILIAVGMFSFSVARAQCSICVPSWPTPTCPSGEVWASRWIEGCQVECACVNEHQVKQWRKKGCGNHSCGCGCAGRIANEEDEATGLEIAPNPVSGSATISFYLLQQENISIRILDMAGRCIAVVANASLDKGDHEIEWTAGNDVLAGVYLLRIEVGSFSKTELISIVR
ncbi:MAG TPA: T9SS type A sorting domain-containing protein [Chitinophagales bacterium]|nr:T9SS type A sorting domain-containing protein [Chitinophagales bacterium]